MMPNLINGRAHFECITCAWTTLIDEGEEARCGHCAPGLPRRGIFYKPDGININIWETEFMPVPAVPAFKPLTLAGQCTCDFHDVIMRVGCQCGGK